MFSTSVDLKKYVTMGPTSQTDNILCSSHEALLNALTDMQPENLHCPREARHIITRKKIIKGNIILKLRKKKMQPVHTLHCQKICRKQMLRTAIAMPTNTIGTTCYHYQQDANYPITMNDWQHLNTCLFTVPSVPVIIPTSSTIITAPISPLVTPVTQPVISPILSQTFLHEDGANVSYYTGEYSYSTEQIEEVERMSNEQTYYIHDGVIIRTDTNSLNTDIASDFELQAYQGDPLESYLKLPKELFPTPSMLALDPNPIIDEFCKMPNLQHQMPWLLDLEFGIPKSPITRPIPTYNVKFNSIHCKNTPDAIHPGFESCDPDFKKVLLFYYDCIISAWYRGYMIWHSDRSVENFQSWLLLPMQVLGMCWP